MLRSTTGGFSGAGRLGLAVANIGTYFKFKNIITEKIFKNPFIKAKTTEI
ncbi:hypothetical protein [Chryseobacterium indoltheticum]